MTRFEEIGAELQGECTSIDQAVRTMEYSCRLCATKGMRIRCDRCAISVAHEQVCTLLMDTEEQKYNEAIARVRRNRKVSQRTDNKTEYVSSYGGHTTHVCRYD